jgi:flagellar biosynthetic protein FliP
MTRKSKTLFLSALFVLLSTPLSAATFSLDIGEGPFSGRLLQILALVTVLSVAPSLLVMVTSFTRIVVVMSILRHALGLQQSPPSSIIMALSLFLTAFVMQPTFETAYKQGISPYLEEKLPGEEALAKSAEPFRKFMLKQVREKDLNLFMEIGDLERPETALETPYRALIPAFMVSELRRAFEIGFLLFIPFLVIDLIVSSVIMAMGMMMLPPVVISLPFKVIFFVLIDGWSMLAGSLVKSYT